MIAVMDYLHDLLFEHAFKRKEIRLEISNSRKQIALNLIKIAVFSRESTWRSEFETLMNEIVLMKLKNRKTKMPAEQYYNALFDGPFEPVEPWNDSYVYSLIISRDILKNKQYKDLKPIQINKQNIELIHNKIKDLLKEVSILLSNPSFTRDKFNELSRKYVEFWEAYNEN